MKNYISALFLGYGVWANAANVNVSPVFDGQSQLSAVIEPMQYSVLKLGAFKSGDKLGLQVVASNKVYNDITACILTEQELVGWQPGSNCRGKQRSPTPFVVQGEIPFDGNYVVVLDNTYANFIKKNIQVNVKFRKSLGADEVENIRRPFQNIQYLISNTFEDAEFNINVRSCGQSNAFSDSRSADITFCTEMINELFAKQNQGAFFAILLHEYGHSLLNRWGEPGSREEDMADQFATVMMLKTGDSGRQYLRDWIRFWEARDSKTEAANQIAYGDTHTLSIQRARNIQQSMNFPEEFTRRWNKMLYRHMKRNYLERIISAPGRNDDVDLAREALRTK
jgi:Putative metallopeptidase